MATPAGTPDLGAIVLPVPNPSCISAVLDIILSNQAFLQAFLRCWPLLLFGVLGFVSIPAMYPPQSLR
jgi:hypothetical protein